MAERPSPIERSFTDLYAELRRMAHYRLRRSEPITLLDTTSLVHESYLKLFEAGELKRAGRGEFLAYASHAMRSIVIDFVRRRRAGRRGGGEARAAIEMADELSGREEEILRVNQALDDLAKVDERLVKMVEMRYFGGLSELEIAESLGTTDRTVRRDWKKAKLLLSLALK